MVDRLRVLRGNPTDEELAALVAALMVRGQAAARSRTPTVRGASLWTASARPGFAHPDGRPCRPHANAWRASARPR